MSRQEIADHFDVSTDTITRWTRDRGAPPKGHILREWARLCDVSYGWLLTGEGCYNEPASYNRLTPAFDFDDVELDSELADLEQRDASVMPDEPPSDQGRP